jgi:hypothetical protein
MSPMAISWIAFGCIFGGALIGMVLRSRLPENHLTPETLSWSRPLADSILCDN